MTQAMYLACSKSKIDTKGKKVPAVDLYTGGMFVKGREYARQHDMPIYILSAKYGLIKEDALIETYEAVFKKPYDWSELDDLDELPPGYYIGGKNYFRKAPEQIKRFIPKSGSGFMLQNLNRVLAGESRKSLFKEFKQEFLG